jgi:SnoaL-like domain
MSTKGVPDMPSKRLPTLLHDFLRALDDADVDRAASCFSADAFFVRPVVDSKTGSSTTQVIQGRDALREYFAERGKKPYRHVITDYITSEKACFVGGVVIEMSSMFMSFADTSAGEITRCTQVATVSPQATIDLVARGASRPRA